ncbi:uncharacterized protein [Apostichopus japonicus]|uniref:uncharacterized protein isoform X2 n=1 Tax=Stichopus japonicus TaxID=307972 RepID=UPI003AB4DE4B
MVATMGKARLYIQCVIYLCVLPRLVSTSQPDIVIDFTWKSGLIISNGYPNTDSIFIGWRIVVEGDYFIRLEFQEFGLHETDNCSIDYFQLFDGPAIDSDKEVGTWCWDYFKELMPNTFISSNNSFYLLFRGHPDHSRKGFRAEYEAFHSVAVTTDPTLISRKTSEDSRMGSSTTKNILFTTTITTTSKQSPSTSSNQTDGPNQLVLIIVLSSVGGALLFSSVCFVVGYLMANALKTKDKRTRSNKGDVSLPLDSRNPVAVSSHTGQGTLQTTDGEGYEDIRHQDNNVHLGISRPKLDVPSNESVVYANEANVYSRSITDVLSDENATKNGNDKPVYSRTFEKY